MALIMMFDGSFRCRLQVVIRIFSVMMNAMTSAANMTFKLSLSEDLEKIRAIFLYYLKQQMTKTFRCGCMVACKLPLRVIVASHAGRW